MGHSLDLKLSGGAWDLARLPLRQGGLAAGATQSYLPRAAAAFATIWTRTAPFVAEQLGYSLEDLLAHDSALASELHVAGQALVQAGLSPHAAP